MRTRARRHHGLAIGLVIGAALALTVAACTDTPASSSKGPAGGTGATGLSRIEGDSFVAEGKAPPEVKKGVVPDVLGVYLEDAEVVIEEAGFKLGELEGGGVGGVFVPQDVICEQRPQGGAKPKPGSKVILVAERECR
jgi:hypothetical protein